MAILNRLMSIIKAKTNTALDEIENPREILELSLSEAKEQLIKIKQSLVQVSTVKKKFEAELSDIEGKIKLLDEQAQMAVTSQREDLAQAALEKKYSLSNKQESIINNILELNNKIKSINQAKEKLEKSIEEIQIRKDELIALNIAADAQLNVKETLTGVTNKVTNINEVLGKFEDKINEKNARVEALDELVDIGSLDEFNKKDSLEVELINLKRQEQIKEELLRLKQKQGSDK